MSTRTPPAWFVRKLREINRHFSVAWNPNRGKWMIQEGVRWTTYQNTRNGAPVYRMHRRPTPALYVAELGSHVLDIVRRNDPRRYRNIDDMIDVLGIDKNERGDPALTLADTLRRA